MAELGEHRRELERRNADLVAQLAAAQRDLVIMRDSEAWRIGLALSRVGAWVFPPNSTRRKILGLGVRAFRLARREGVMALCKRAIRRHRLFLHSVAVRVGLRTCLEASFPIEAAESRYRRWLEADRLTSRARSLIERDINALSHRPLISIIMPVYNPPVHYLREAIRSVQTQLYARWELCICDDGSNPDVVMELEAAAADDPRVRLTRIEHAGISAASNAALALAKGEFVGFLDHDDLLHPCALYHIVKAIDRDRTLDVLYTDRDHVTHDGMHHDPFFKPDWSPTTILSHNYLIHFLVIRRSLITEVGGFRKDFDGAQDYDLILRVTERTRRILHIPYVLYSWRRHVGSSSVTPRPHAYQNAARAIQEALIRRGEKGFVTLAGERGPYKVSYTLRGSERVSIVICTRGRLDFLRTCISSIRKKTTWPNYDITVVTDRSNGVDLEAWCDQARVPLIGVPDGFYSRMNNIAARRTTGEFVLFLHDDIEIVTADWLQEMMMACQFRDVAAVGPKILNKVGTIQFTRMVLGIRRDGRPYFFDPFATFKTNYLWGFPSEVVSDVSALSAACMLVKRDAFDRVGGFDEGVYGLSWQDVHLCLELRRRGMRVVYTPYAIVRHYGSATKRTDFELLEWDVAVANEFFSRHIRELREGDPFFNPNLTDVQGFLEAPAHPGVRRFSVERMYYGEDYWERYGFLACPRNHFLHDRGSMLEALGKFAARVKEVFRCRSALDVGCDLGYLVQAFLEAGVDAWGVEMSDEVLRLAPELVRARILIGSILDPAVVSRIREKGRFGVVTCMGVLERLPEECVGKAIQAICSVAEVVIVTTPRPNYWDLRDPTNVCVKERSYWVARFSEVGWHEDRASALSVFGPGYDVHEDSCLLVFRP